MDVIEMFQPVTKWAVRMRHPDTIPEIVRKAIRLARSEKPGAVHIELPENVAKLGPATTPIQPRRYRRPVPDDKGADAAFEMLRDARKPVIVAGNGTIRRRASKQLRDLCDKTGIGVLCIFMSKGAVDTDAPYCLYTIGLGTRDRTNVAIDEADLVITLGPDMVEYHPRLWEDGAYGLIALKQEKEFGRHTDLSFGNPEWLTLVHAFGWNGHRVTRSRDLGETLERAFQEEGPGRRSAKSPIQFSY